MVRELFRKNGALRVDSKLMPDVKFELHEMVQALVNDIHAVAFADDPEGPPRVAGEVESRVITSKHVEQVLKRLGMRVWMPSLEDAAERRSRKAGNFLAQILAILFYKISLVFGCVGADLCK